MNRDKQQLIQDSYGSHSSRVKADLAKLNRSFHPAYHSEQLRTYAHLMTKIEWLSPHLVALSLPLYSSKVPAGFPSPAEEHVEKRLNPNDYLIDQEDATFFVSVQGYSMIELGLMPGDKAVVDRSKTPKIGDVVLAVVDGEFTIKTLAKNKVGQARLMPANKDFKPIEITEEMQFQIWGVVIGSFRRFR
jgi:DNA polymerase V